MPNHCSNQLTIRGDEFHRKRFALQAYSSDTRLDLDNFSPMPFALSLQSKMHPDPRSPRYRELLVKAYGFDNWYDWRIKHWGTKWGCYHVRLSIVGRVHHYNFSTAWSPFSPGILESMARMFPMLSFELLFAEIGCAYYGSMKAANGKLGVCSESSLDDVSFYDCDSGKFIWPAHLSEEIIRLLESSG